MKDIASVMKELQLENVKRIKSIIVIVHQEFQKMYYQNGGTMQ